MTDYPRNSNNQFTQSLADVFFIYLHVASIALSNQCCSSIPVSAPNCHGGDPGMSQTTCHFTDGSFLIAPLSVLSAGRVLKTMGLLTAPSPPLVVGHIVPATERYVPLLNLRTKRFNHMPVTRFSGM